ncbi:MAG: ferredoxin [Carbonactinosporaceae bacterium]
MWQVRADTSKCEGYANCVVASPYFFDVDDTGLVQILHTDIDEARRAEGENAVRSCPTEALWIDEG